MYTKFEVGVKNGVVEVKVVEEVVVGVKGGVHVVNK